MRKGTNSLENLAGESTTKRKLSRKEKIVDTAGNITAGIIEGVPLDISAGLTT